MNKGRFQWEKFPAGQGLAPIEAGDLIFLNIFDFTGASAEIMGEDSSPTDG